MPILLPVLVRRSARDTTVAATLPAVTPASRAPRKGRPGLHPHALKQARIVVERVAGEEKSDGIVFPLEAFRR